MVSGQFLPKRVHIRNPALFAEHQRFMLQIVDAQPFSFGQRVIIRHGAADGIAAQNEVAALAALLKFLAGNARNQVDLTAEIFEKNAVSFKIGIKGNDAGLSTDVPIWMISFLPRAAFCTRSSTLRVSRISACAS